MKIKDILELDRLYEWSGSIIEWNDHRNLDGVIKEIYCEPKNDSVGFRYDFKFEDPDEENLTISGEKEINPIYQQRTLVGMEVNLGDGGYGDVIVIIKKPLNFVRGLKLKDVNGLLIQP